MHLHCTCRQKRHPIPLSPWPRQQQQHYLAWWLSKCSLWGVRSYFQTISQDDNSPTPCTAPLSTICGPRWANSSAHSWRQKYQANGGIKMWHNLNLMQQLLSDWQTWALKATLSSQSLCWETRDSNYVPLPVVNKWVVVGDIFLRVAGH